MGWRVRFFLGSGAFAQPADLAASEVRAGMTGDALEHAERCDRGEAEGCGDLGRLYRWGDGGLERSDGAAVRLYRKACADEDAWSCVNLGYMYEKGLGVEQDYMEAARLYGLGCDGGNMRGCSNLGDVTYRGLGSVRSDRAEGLWLLRKGCEGGNEWGCERLAEIEGK